MTTVKSDNQLLARLKLAHLLKNAGTHIYVYIKIRCLLAFTLEYTNTNKTE